ncbi:phage antirepressor KilAC domain-containing protein [Fusobacterium pseudoperiodonticum]|uniref:Oxidoreductase n=1 Tax=Fusobacterium pseudoperiodonticum TaxID=2663009 RepID=A0AAD0AQV3_9FUSO|nr:antA/AntB antirepressor family protein [Fusobacterium pseudoperiodonticum]ATV35333.1 oxidoreductase [Fusobacterium pseudoperiodonticum]ATV61772.1 oxidoreductase [Fusobacterium pseudoperiodonticum]
MNELIKIEVKDGQQLASGRELHKFLEIGTEYMKWFSRMINYGFVENIDFIVIVKNDEDDTAFGGIRKSTDHLIKLNMAKEISMLQRNEKGKEARTYFIKCEEAWNSPEMILARANQIQSRMIEDYTKKIEVLENKIQEDKPKVEFYNDVTDSKHTCDMQTVAKVLNFKGVGRNTLFEILRNENILQPDNKPYQKFVDAGWFRLIETKYNDEMSGELRIYFKTVVFQKGIEKISNILKGLGYLQLEK